MAFIQIFDLTSELELVRGEEGYVKMRGKRTCIADRELTVVGRGARAAAQVRGYR